MKIITAKQQGEAYVHLANIRAALTANNDVKLVEAFGDICKLAHIIGGMDGVSIMDPNNKLGGMRNVHY